MVIFMTRTQPILQCASSCVGDACVRRMCGKRSIHLQDITHVKLFPHQKLNSTSIKHFVCTIFAYWQLHNISYGSCFFLNHFTFTERVKGTWSYRTIIKLVLQTATHESQALTAPSFGKVPIFNLLKTNLPLMVTSKEPGKYSTCITFL